jgi:hypothetical protein
VLVTLSNKSAKQSTVTDENGAFAFDNAVVGNRLPR